MTSNSTDRGSATLWVLVCAALVLVVGWLGTVRALAVLGRHRAESAADLVALAAAGRIGVGDDYCVFGTRIARANGADVIGCTAELAADGRSGSVLVRVRVRVTLPLAGAFAATASARAGRGPVGVGPPPPAAPRRSAGLRLQVRSLLQVGEHEVE